MSQKLKNCILATSTIPDGNMSFRFGDAKKVISNRQQFLVKNGVDYTDCVCMKCNHGSIVTAINRSNYAANFGATKPKAMVKSEVLVTNEPGVVLLLLTADCLPVAFYDPIKKVIALAHLNRKTIAHDLGQKTVHFMTNKFNCDPTDLIVAIGPHIKKESYRFPLPLTEPTPTQLLDHIETSAVDIAIDLPRAEISQLVAVGVQKKNISISKIDTAVSDKRFSHYRSQRDPSHPEGRMATILALPATQ